MMITQNLLDLAQTTKPYTIKDLNYIFNKINPLIVTDNKKISYYNIAISFDIETTSIKSTQMDKFAFMYIWQFCIDGYIIVGREWNEFLYLLDTLTKYYELSEQKRMIIYIHNLGFEFQFMRKRLEWSSVFSLDKRKPIKAVTIEGIEFRCSYILSGYSLAKLGTQLLTFKISKKTGDLDYDKIRHSKTPLTNEEIQYCVNDVLVVVAYIQELINREGDITKIPLTKTGYVRRYCRDMCLYEGSHKNNTVKFIKYHNLIKNLTLTKEVYTMLQQAFGGGFTHANPKYVGKVMKNVESFDLCSAYPYAILSEQYPMSKFEQYIPKDIDDFNKTLKRYCCLLTVEIYNIRSKVKFDNYISSSHCIEKILYEENNGRIYSADKIVITLTEQDYNIVKRTYSWEDMKLVKLYRARKEYLPRDFMLAVLKLFGDKTVLKDVEGRELDYLISKENLNSCYGMMVTDICRDEVVYNDDEWDKGICDIDHALQIYNKSKKRFLYYPWGVWVTAYNRRNLWSAILEFGDDYIYSDTDSVKVMNKSRHMDYISNYNKWVLQRLELAFLERNIDIKLTHPKNKYGKEKQLGQWEDEGVYKKFKTLGAKRYMIENEKGVNITVSGLNKSTAVPYILRTYSDPFKAFDENLYIPPNYTGKMTHTYIDTELQGNVTDYLGNEGSFHEFSATHLENCDYKLSLSDKFVKFLLGFREFSK